jgi:hypothetical protein
VYLVVVSPVSRAPICEKHCKRECYDGGDWDDSYCRYDDSVELSLGSRS